MVLPSANTANPSLPIIECGLTAITFVAAFTWPRLGAGWFTRMEQAFGRLARRKGLAAVTVGLSVLVLRLAILPLFPTPLPFVPDDFSFLLAAQTFAHGRLTNPTPAMWTHFESIHITMLPTYQSMYFPGQGLLLAAGQVLFGSPWFAILLSSALMCAALTWMLQAWLPANWALVGGFIAVLRLGVFSYWTDTYHAAGSLAALGGALMLGALPRLMKRPRVLYAMLMGVGVAILALTRPYEGILLCLPVGFVLGRWMWKGANRPDAAAVVRLTAAALVFVIVAVGWLGYYDYRAFGKVTTLPYTVDRTPTQSRRISSGSSSVPNPLTDTRRCAASITRANSIIFAGSIRLSYFCPTPWPRPRLHSCSTRVSLSSFRSLMIRRVFLDRRIRFLVLCVLVIAAGMTIEIYLLPHYVAPIHRCLLRHRLTSHAPPAGMEVGRQARRPGPGADDRNPLRRARRHPPLRRAASNCAQRVAGQQLELRVVGSAAFRRRTCARSNPGSTSFPAANWSSCAIPLSMTHSTNGFTTPPISTMPKSYGQETQVLPIIQS